MFIYPLNIMLDNNRSRVTQRRIRIYVNEGRIIILIEHIQGAGRRLFLVLCFRLDHVHKKSKAGEEL